MVQVGAVLDMRVSVVLEPQVRAILAVTAAPTALAAVGAKAHLDRMGPAEMPVLVELVATAYQLGQLLHQLAIVVTMLAAAAAQLTPEYRRMVV